MTDKKFRPSGRLFKAKEKKTDKSPDWTGELEIGPEVLADLLLKADSGEVAKMRLLAYENTHPQYGVWYRLIAVKDEPFNREKSSHDTGRKFGRQGGRVPF